MLFRLITSGLSTTVIFAIILAYLVALTIAFSMHEFSHGLAAYLHGDLTAKMAGRLSLNPMKHIDPLGLVCLLLLGFGWAKPVPYNPMNLRDGKRGMFAVAIAGVLANLALAFVFSMIYVLVHNYASEAFNSSFGGIFLTYFLYLSININIYLFLFNLLPLYPLDGAKILELFVNPVGKFMEFLRKYSTIILLILILTTVLSLFLSVVSSYIFDGFTGLWSLIFRFGR